MTSPETQLAAALGGRTFATNGMHKPAGGAATALIALAQLPLSKLERCICGQLAQHFQSFIPTERVVSNAYADDADGGPDDAESVVKTTIFNARKKLAGTILDIESHPGSGYRLVWSGVAPETASPPVLPIAAPDVAPPAAGPRFPRALREGEIHLGNAGADVIGLHLGKLIEGRLLIQGNSGAGKSMLLRRLFEQAFGQVQQVLVDIDGEFSTLAEKFDVAVLEAGEILRIGGRALALHLREHRYSAVVDLSDATSEQQLTAAADLASGLVEAPREHWHPLLFLIDETQRLAPYYDTGDVETETRKRAIAAIADLMGRGRKRGLAGVIATQRIAETAKAVISKATNVIVGRTVFDRDLERSGAILGFTAGASRPLRTLKDGEFICLGPALGGPLRLRFKSGPVQSRHKGDAPAIAAPPVLSATRSRELLAQVPTETPANASAGESRPAPSASSGRRRAAWTAPEDAIMREGYAAARKLPEIGQALVDGGFPSRSLSAISVRGQMLGLINSNRSGRNWTPAEDGILRQGYNEGISLIEIVARLSRAGFERHRNATQMRAIALGITGDRVNYWSEEEKAIAIAGLDAGKRHADILADMRAAGYHRGTTAINRFAKLHGRQRVRDNPWTDEHLDILRECYASSAGPKEAMKRLGRPYSSIVGKASALGISINREYPLAEREKMITMHGRGARLIDVAKALDRPYTNVAAVAKRMGLEFIAGNRKGRARAARR